jgi:sec-independent protein translocase protein TatB
MFDLSWSEMFIVAIVGLLVIGPEELPGVIRNCKKVIAKVKSSAKEFTSAITDIDEIDDLKNEANKLNEDMKTIIDLEGNEQPTYDISDLIGKNEQRNNNGTKQDSNKK